MKKNCRHILFLLLLFFSCSNIYAEAVRVSFEASAYVLAPPPAGVSTASFSPLFVNSNNSVKIAASIEGHPTNVMLFFHDPATNFVLNLSGTTFWTDSLKPYKTQSAYTASFIVIYSNGFITNRNKAVYYVDNTPPHVISSIPTNNSFVENTGWNMVFNLQDPGGAGLNHSLTASNSTVHFSGADGLLGTFDDLAVPGKWTNTGISQITFIPQNKPSIYGRYGVSIFPVDRAGNTNHAGSTVQFLQTNSLSIISVRHCFEKNTQLTPDVPLEVFLHGSPGAAAFFKVVGASNIIHVPMSEISNGYYRGQYIVKKTDRVLDGIVRGYLRGTFASNYLDSDISIDIGEESSATRGKDLFIVSPDDIYTKLLVPDGSLKEDARIDIRHNNNYPDKIAFDFNMDSAADGSPITVFKHPLKIYIHYSVHNGNVDVLNVNESDLQKTSTLLFFDRVQWLKVGGSADPVTQLFTGTVKHFSLFALGADVKKDKLTVAPNPFTPGRHSDFDRIHFIGDLKLGEPEKAEIRIFSRDGFLRKTLNLDSGTLNNMTVDIMWDGVDEGGRDCPESLYIYQAKLGDRKFNGTFVLAR